MSNKGAGRYLLSEEKLTEVNTWNKNFPLSVHVVDTKEEVDIFLSFRATSLGFPSVKVMQKREPIYIYEIPTEVTL